MTGIVSDGKSGNRAFKVIGETFPTYRIVMPFPRSSRVDDPGLTLHESVSPAAGAWMMTFA